MFQKSTSTSCIRPGIQIFRQATKNEGFESNPFSFNEICPPKSDVVIISLTCMMKNVPCLLLLSFVMIVVSCEKKSKIAEVRVDSTALKYSILKTLPHDDKAFTEGMAFHGDKLLEST